MSSDYPPGTTLEVRGERWTLARSRRFGACTLLTLNGAEACNTALTLNIIDPFDRPRRVRRHQLRRRPRRAVLRAALGAIATARPVRGLWSAGTAAIDVLPYQLEPALAVIGGATRLLLADAVGLGKTIQAGLIVAELHARGWAERTLIVCPSGLRDTWATELRERFALTAAVVDHVTLAERVATLPPGSNPWGAAGITIVSIDLLKRPEVLSAVDRVAIDLLIADEAHHLTPGTDRGAAVARLAGRSPWVALLSATPHSGDAAAFSYLTSIGAQHDELTIFRRTRGDTSTTVARRSHLLAVHPTGRERALLAAVDRYVEAIWHGRGVADRAVRLVAITVARRAASSVDALTHSLARRLALLAGAPIREPEQGLLRWEEADAGDAIDDDGVLAARGLDDPAAERRLLEQLLALARACSRSSKIARLMRLLDVIREPALVFTEFRDTLHAIAAQLDQSRYAIIHGGMAPDARREATARFTAGRANVLLATDAAGEGLNLHHRCRLVIDMELPWNPLRLEQRFGRVDRIGQRRTVHAIRLFHPGTIEARVLEHLRLRQQCADAALDPCVSELDVADATFGERPLPPGPRLTGSRIIDAPAEAARIVTRRAWLGGGASTHSGCWTAARSGRLTALYRSTFVNDAGWPVADLLEAHQVELSRAPSNRRQWRRLIEFLSGLPSPVLVDAPARRQLADRIAAIRAMVAHRALVEYQRSLFDHRADAEAAERDRTAASLDAALERTRKAAASLDAGRARRELVAAWPEQAR